MLNYKNKLIVLVILILIFSFMGNTSAQSQNNSVTLIVDHSGSMDGANATKTKESVEVLLNMIELWGDLFPQKIGNMKLQYIKFTEEAEVFHALDTNLSKLDADNIGDFDGGTHYISGIEKAINELKSKSYNNRTLFLTDGADSGKIPNRSNYNQLGPTKFIVFGDAAFKEPWLNKIPDSSLFRANNNEVTTLFMRTLFEFTNDIRNYLVRDGQRKVNAGAPFTTTKHSSNPEHTVLIALANENISLTKITDKQGNELASKKYSTGQQGTFSYVKLESGVPAGEYKIHYDGINKQQQFKYMSFEEADISLGVKTKPVRKQFIAGEQINFNFYFEDAQGNKIDYPDFLKNVYHKVEIRDDGPQISGTDSTNISFSHSYADNSSERGQHNIYADWSYNSVQAISSLSQVTQFEVQRAGSLVDLKYDETECWEGRDLKLTAKLQEPKGIVDDLGELTLQTGHGSVKLKQSKSRKNQYQGVIKDLKPGQYQFSLANHPDYELGLSNKTSSQVKVKARKLVLKTNLPTYKSYENISIWEKVKLAVDDLLNSTNFKASKEYKTSLTSGRIKLPYKLPYKDKIDNELYFNLTVNKLFPNEKANLNLNFNNQSSFDHSPVKKDYFLGLLTRSLEMENTVTVKPNFKTNPVIRANGAYNFPLEITKKKGGMNINSPLTPKPEIGVNGEISGGQNKINLGQSDISIELSTSKHSVLAEGILKFGYRGLMIILLLILICTILIRLIIRRRNFLNKLKTWEEIKDKSPQDFYDDFPEKIHTRVQNHIEENRSELDELADEEILKKRALRQLINNDNDFDEYVAKKFKQEDLNNLQEKLTELNYDSSWKFYWGDNPRTIEICNLLPDEGLLENKVRVRSSRAPSYAKIRISGTAGARRNIKFENLGHTNIFYINNNGMENNIAGAMMIDGQPEFKIGDTANPYFRLIVSVNRANNCIKIQIQR